MNIKRRKKYFRKLFKEHTKEYNIKQVENACKDPSGAELFRIIKQLEPKLNKKAKKFMVNTTEAENEAEEIANKFESIFSEKDVDPTASEE